jgi:Fe2+ or Zn2+ uptake regulation protein
VPKPLQYRESILELLRENPIHPTVDWIHGKLRGGHPKVSLATVYRTLKALVREGVLCELPFGASEARFGLIAEERHYHFICEACHRIYDLPLHPKVELETAVREGTGHEVNRHTMEFYGRCRECSGRGPAAKPKETRRAKEKRS